MNRVQYKIRCVFHLTQDAERAMLGWGLTQSLHRDAFRHHFRNIKHAPDVEAYELSLKAFERHFQAFPKAVAWLRATIDNCGDAFLHHRIPFQEFQGLTTNNHIESFNRMIKYSEACLGGRRNRLLAHLLEKLVHLCGTLCLRRLHKQDGRMAHNRRLAHDAARHERSLILLSGLSKGDDVVDVYDEETGLVQVRSLAGDVRYTVCLSTQSCDCPDSSKGFVCKHQWVAQAILPPGGFKSWGYYGVGDAPLRDIMTAELVQQSSMPTTLDLGPYALPVIDTSF
jgi:hypothetical protein